PSSWAVTRLLQAACGHYLSESGLQPRPSKVDICAAVLGETMRPDRLPTSRVRTRTQKRKQPRHPNLGRGRVVKPRAVQHVTLGEGLEYTELKLRSFFSGEYSRY